MDVYTFKTVVEQLDDAMTMLVSELYESAPELLEVVNQNHERVISMLARELQ